MKKVYITLGILLLLLGAVCAQTTTEEVKKDFKKAGKEIKKTTKMVGKETKKAGRKTKKVTKAVSKDLKKEATKAKKAVKKGLNQ